MVILQVIHDFLDRARAGSEIYTYCLSKELIKKGHKVALFFFPLLICRLNRYARLERKKIMKNVIDNIDMFVAPSQFLKNVLVKDFIPEQKIVCRGYGIDPNEFRDFRKQPRDVIQNW